VTLVGIKEIKRKNTFQERRLIDVDKKREWG
jgi:hypothetical protein